jgi:Asp-tRNA(Asn)/Glu-tRNA(Gln) amidotransferase A subunit family amidase
MTAQSMSSPAASGEALTHSPAVTLAAMLRDGQISACELMTACLERIAACEPQIRAWAFLDPDNAIEQARLADRRRAEGLPLGPLHGLPVGVKDVFDSFDMPSEYGSETLRGRRPASDADAVALLRQAGAIIAGKTTTSEFGMYHPSATRNPHDISRSPGVSSAGSAAAVVAGMVPLALGTQHMASSTLPASFCGAVAFKPSLGFTSMAGSNVLVPRLAHVGFLARSSADLRLFAGAYHPSLSEVPPDDRAAPRLGVVRGAAWPAVDAGVRAALDAFTGALPTTVAAVALPDEFDRAVEVAFDLLNAHLAFRFGSEPDETRRRYCRALQDGIAAGRAISAAKYLADNASADRLAELASGLFDGHDALMTLSAPTEALRLEEGPGSGTLSTPWSLCGLPTVSLPLLKGPQGLPVGVQLIGRRGGDGALLGAAAWLENVSVARTDS